MVLDSGAYGDDVPVPAILDALIAGKRIAPLVAVMVGNLSRTEALQCSPAYTSFLARELVPWMRETYHAGATPALTVVSGASLGGLAASFAAFQHPDVFGNAVDYLKFNGNHSYLNWRTDLASRLVRLIGPPR